ncbi:alpha-amylase family protein [Corynebacterium pacaense]|uniref:alpha-amylase family protein n=1 Tax=Corynebacterium pacaense TaxID=1816684 RepID=UPI0009BC6EB9|nr:alpha-amylase family protein [Corynebacterium pacaense]
MSFAEHAIIWHIYPLGALGAPIRPEEPIREVSHRLRGLGTWLDYVVELGCNAVMCAPVFTSESHGYDTVDFYSVDPRLGDERDLDEFIAAAEGRGIGIILDGVFNHVARSSGYVDLCTGDSFEGHEALMELDHTREEVVDLVSDVMCFWLDRGIAGWRLDAAYAIDPAFWARVLPRVRGRHPRAWIVGEMIHGDYAAYVSESGIDSVTQYELWKAIWSSLKEENFYELEWTLSRHNEFLESFVPQTFVGNHDVTRIATKVGQNKAVLAAAILFTVGGTPSIYYGDEQGFTGTKEDRLGGDDDIRPPLPEKLSPLGEWIHRAYQQLIALRRRHPWLHTAHTEVEDLSNTEITYRAIGGDGEWIRVRVSVEPVAVRVSGVDGETLFEFDGNPAAGS